MMGAYTLKAPDGVSKSVQLLTHDEGLKARAAHLGVRVIWWAAARLVPCIHHLQCRLLIGMICEHLHA